MTNISNVELNHWSSEDKSYNRLSLKFYEKKPTTTKVGKWEHFHTDFLIRVEKSEDPALRKPFLFLSGSRHRFSRSVSLARYRGRAWNIKDAVKTLLKKKAIPAEYIDYFKLILEYL